MENVLRKSLGQEGYQDIRFEDLTQTSIVYKGKELDSITASRLQGGHARALAGGGWGTFSYTELDQTPNAAKEALAASKLIPGSFSLAKVPKVQEEVGVEPKGDPREIPLAEKKSLLEKYNNMILKHEGIQSTEARYYELNRMKHFCNNEGSMIHQEQLLVGIILRIIARRGSIIQRTSVALGGSPHFQDLLNKEEEIEEKVKETLGLLDAEPVKAGNYTVILDPDCTSVFIHEAFGHLSESDFLANNPSLQKVMVLGRQFGPPFLNVIDDPNIPDLPGYFRYDDEGVQGKETFLIKDGKLSGRLHSRETAGKLGEEPTGNCRAQNYTFTPIVRMTTTYIDNGPHTFLEMLESIDNGLYLKGAGGGQTSGEFFTFGTQIGYKIENGKLGPMVRDATLSGNLFKTLDNIEMVGNDLIFRRAGGCGKGSQVLADVSSGAPHVKIRDMAIGGR